MQTVSTVVGGSKAKRIVLYTITRETCPSMARLKRRTRENERMPETERERKGKENLHERSRLTKTSFQKVSGLIFTHAPARLSIVETFALVPNSPKTRRFVQWSSELV